jgi:hypothetical protein
MYTYKMEQTEQTIYIIDPETLGQEAALQSHIRESTEVIRVRAHTICVHILAERPYLTNDPQTFIRRFVNKYSKAYRDEIVSLRHQMCITMLNCGQR